MQNHHNIENSLPEEFDFEIQSEGPVSIRFMDMGIRTFAGAIDYLRHLPYGRNANKEDLTTVFTDGKGTCSTKHALLHQLATENEIAGIKLLLGIMKMNARNMPEITGVLERYNIAFIPEAHNYLMAGNQIIDCTKPDSRPDAFMNELLAEIEISPSQITEFKVDYHKRFLQDWLQEHPEIPYSLAEFWEIRESCIQAIADNQVR